MKAKSKDQDNAAPMNGVKNAQMSFLDLPAELRNSIYRFAIITAGQFWLYTNGENRYSVLWKVQESRSGLLCTSRQVQAKVQSIFHREMISDTQFGISFTFPVFQWCHIRRLKIVVEPNRWFQSILMFPKLFSLLISNILSLKAYLSMEILAPPSAPVYSGITNEGVCAVMQSIPQHFAALEILQISFQGSVFCEFYSKLEETEGCNQLAHAVNGVGAEAAHNLNRRKRATGIRRIHESLLRRDSHPQRVKFGRKKA